MSSDLACITNTGEPPTSHLTIQPEHVNIEVELGRDLFLDFTLTNTSNSLVTFKVKTTSRDRYLLRPTQGYIAPHATMVCKIVMGKMSQYPDQTNLKDKFLVMSTLLEKEVSDLTNYWKALETQHNPTAHQFMFAETRVKCKLQLPGKFRALQVQANPNLLKEHELALPQIPATNVQMERVRTPLHQTQTKPQQQSHPLPTSSKFVSEDGSFNDEPTVNGWEEFKQSERMVSVAVHVVIIRINISNVKRHLYRNYVVFIHQRIGKYLLSEFVISFMRVLALQELLDEENVKLGAMGLKWSLNTFWTSGSRYQHGPTTRWSPKQEIKFTMVWIPGVREAYEAAQPDQRQITKEPYPEQLLSPIEKGRRAAIKAEEEKQQQARAMEEQKQLQLAQLQLLQSLVAQGQLSAAQVSALGLNSNGSSSSGPPIYGIEPSAPPPYVPMVEASFCTGCGASHAGVTGPFCPQCGFKSG